MIEWVDRFCFYFYFFAKLLAKTVSLGTLVKNVLIRICKSDFYNMLHRYKNVFTSLKLSKNTFQI